ncbi:MAG: PEP-CTERM sorting domain-containing protein [Armatimonadetes bacterium]|nr:PEP-CTERM sorting domain-containing protein [Armatimonadota bacterium]
MKVITGGPSNLVAVLLAVGLGASAYPQFDSAADPIYNDGWQTGDNGGTGFGPWSLSTSGNAGSLVITSNNNGSGGGPGIDSAGRSLGGFADDGSLFAASRLINTPLSPGDFFSANFDNGLVDTSALVLMGLSAPGAGSTIRFVGGATNYELVDSGGSATSTIGFTDGGLLGRWDVLTPTSYQFTLTRLSDNASWNTTRTIGNTAFDRFIFQNAGAGATFQHDAFVNSFTVVPEPGTFAALGLCALALLRKGRKPTQRTPSVEQPQGICS